jgi:hypothetical protein
MMSGNIAPAWPEKEGGTGANFFLHFKPAFIAMERIFDSTMDSNLCQS